MSVALVIPVLNQLAHTRACLACLAPDRAAGVRVIVVDNGSTDSTAEFLATQPDLTVISNPTNRGCAPAWNQGVAAAGAAEWTIVLNNDVLLPEGWLAALLGAARRHRLDLVCPALREGDLSYDFPAHARAFMARLGGVVRHGAAHGVCFAVHRAVFARVGPFDEAFRLGQFEDADFFRRARAAGFRLGVVGACVLHHFGSVTQEALSDATGARPYEAENRAHFRRKWRLGWWRRRVERSAAALRSLRWRLGERLRHGHTLHEKLAAGRLRHH